MHKLPAQPLRVSWPTRSWPEATCPMPGVDATRLTKAADSMFAAAESERFGTTLSLLAVHRGHIVLERYGTGVEPEATQPSWSMAKSVLHAIVGQLVADGLLDLDAPAAVPAWRSDDDPRRAITLEHLLRMVDGLDFIENYEEGGRADVVEMLRDARTQDTAKYAEARPQAHPPGAVFNYSSGTSMIVSAIVKRALGGRERTVAYMRERLFEPIGMHSAIPRFDAAGTFIGSSFVFATARDFVRFGLLYLRDGIWDGERLLPHGWVDHARTATPASAGQYGAHWWLDLAEPGTFCAKGYRGQYTLASPQRDAVIVRLGVSTEPQRVHVVEELGEILASIPPHPPENPVPGEGHHLRPGNEGPSS